METKVVLITGASAGIGLSAAVQLMEKGVRVYAASRRGGIPQKAQNGVGELIPVQMDVNNPDVIASVVAQILKENNRLDAVICNAGNGIAGSIEDTSNEEMRYQFETNFFGLHEVTLQTMKIFRKQGFGKIIQHSSVLGLISLKYRGAYNASKYAIEGINDTLRQEVIGSNIFISTVNTGPVTSKFRENALKKFNENIDIQNSYFSEVYKKELKTRLETKEDKAPFNLPASSVGNIVLKIMESKKPKPRYYVTSATHILGFLKRVLSTSLMDKLLNKI